MLFVNVCFRKDLVDRQQWLMLRRQQSSSTTCRGTGHSQVNHFSCFCSAKLYFHKYPCSLLRYRHKYHHFRENNQHYAFTNATSHRYISKHSQSIFKYCLGLPPTYRINKAKRCLLHYLHFPYLVKRTRDFAFVWSLSLGTFVTVSKCQ